MLVFLAKKNVKTSLRPKGREDKCIMFSSAQLTIFTTELSFPHQADKLCVTVKTSG